MNRFKMKVLIADESIDETIMMKRRKRRRKLLRIKLKMSKSKFIMIVLTTTMICCCLTLKLAYANDEKISSQQLFVEKARQLSQPFAQTRVEQVFEDRSLIDTEAEAELEEEEELNWRQKFEVGSNLNSNSNLKQLNKRHASASFGGHSLFGK